MYIPYAFVQAPDFTISSGTFLFIDWKAVEGVGLAAKKLNSIAKHFPRGAKKKNGLQKKGFNSS